MGKVQAQIHSFIVNLFRQCRTSLSLKIQTVSVSNSLRFRQSVFSLQQVFRCRFLFSPKVFLQVISNFYFLITNSSQWFEYRHSLKLHHYVNPQLRPQWRH